MVIDDCISEFVDLGVGSYFLEGLGGFYFLEVSFSGFNFKMFKYVNFQDGMICGEFCDFFVFSVIVLVFIIISIWFNFVNDQI